MLSNPGACHTHTSKGPIMFDYLTVPSQLEARAFLDPTSLELREPEYVLDVVKSL